MKPGSTPPPVIRDCSPPGGAWGRPINAWPEGERPRERLLDQGPQALSDAELIAVLLGQGSRGRDAVATGRAMLQQAGSLVRLLAMPGDLPRVAGVGPVKRARLMAAMELARRALAENLTERQAIGDPRACGAFLKARLGAYEREVFAVLFLDARHRVLAFEELFKGTVDAASVYPREVVRACLRHHATAVILAHNHPSGDTTPSEADQDITALLRGALGLIQVDVLDHFIIGAGQPYSMAAHGDM